MQCSFCADSCCQYGVDVSIVERDRILARAEEIVPLARAPQGEWFETEITIDAEFPGGASSRTRVVNGRCVFLRRDDRGCVLHGLALATNTDYHDIKPMVSTLFPVTWGDETLYCAEELVEESLVCAGSGPTAYEMARSELLFYFGNELVLELDQIASSFTSISSMG